jgi:hypothetical protein
MISIYYYTKSQFTTAVLNNSSTKVRPCMFYTTELYGCFLITVSRRVVRITRKHRQQNQWPKSKLISLPHPSILMCPVASRSHFVEHLAGLLVELETLLWRAWLEGAIGAIVRVYPPPLDPCLRFHTPPKHSTCRRRLAVRRQQQQYHITSRGVMLRPRCSSRRAMRFV